jgi:hypothetical protein
MGESDEAFRSPNLLLMLLGLATSFLPLSEGNSKREKTEGLTIAISALSLRKQPAASKNRLFLLDFVSISSTLLLVTILDVDFSGVSLITLVITSED